MQIPIFSDRKNIYDIFSDKEWVEIDEPNLEIGSYLNKIQHSLFVLCPWGNGVDTHRVWETLYSGSIPVIKNHQTFTCLKDLPALFINNYEEINLDLLNEFAEKYYSNTFNYEKLKMNYWENLIKNNKKLIHHLKEFFKKVNSILLKQSKALFNCKNWSI